MKKKQNREQNSKNINKKKKNSVKKNRKLKHGKKINEKTKNDPEQHIANIHAPLANQKTLTAKSKTKKNACKTRRNPYFIYSQKKKDEFYKKLNEQYETQIKKDANSNSTKEEINSKSVIFNQQIQIRQYENEEEVAAFLQNVPILEQVNEEENKLDC